MLLLAIYNKTTLLLPLSLNFSPYCNVIYKNFTDVSFRKQMHTTPRCGNVSSQWLQLYEAARAEVVRRVKGCDGLTGMDTSLEKNPTGLNFRLPPEIAPDRRQFPPATEN